MKTTETPANYLRELTSYERQRSHLKEADLAKIALIHGEEFVGVFATVADACAEARRRFGQEPVMLKQIGAPEDYLHYGPAPESAETIRLSTDMPSNTEKAEVFWRREIAAYERHRAELER